MKLTLAIVAALAFCLSRSVASSLLVNHEFTGSLTSWTASGTVFNTGDSAVFSDSVVTPTSLFQSVIVPTDFQGFDLVFDFFNGLSSTVQPGFVPDVFFATIYLGVDPFGPSLAGGLFDMVIPLFDLDHTGAFNLASGATLSTSPKGAGWTRYSLTRQTAPFFTDPGYMTVAFEFFDLNGTGSDSVAAVDNVALLKAIPEPGKAALLLLSSIFAILRRRR
jgi:hypothetical protein